MFRSCKTPLLGAALPRPVAGSNHRHCVAPSVQQPCSDAQMQCGSTLMLPAKPDRLPVMLAVQLNMIAVLLLSDLKAWLCVHCSPKQQKQQKGDAAASHAD